MQQHRRPLATRDYILIVIASILTAATTRFWGEWVWIIAPLLFAVCVVLCWRELTLGRRAAALAFIILLGVVLRFV